jgi:dynein heavy chain
MGEVESMMKRSVKAALNHSVDDYAVRERKSWVISHSGQCVLNGSQVVWTHEV